MSLVSELFYVYILTNPAKTALYVGVTNNLTTRLVVHWDNRGNRPSFAGRYYCYNLIFYETFSQIASAIAREKEIKKWNREKKEALIRSKNPGWVFLNTEVCGEWPPVKNTKRF